MSTTRIASTRGRGGSTHRTNEGSRRSPRNATKEKGGSSCKYVKGIAEESSAHDQCAVCLDFFGDGPRIPLLILSPS